ncbi:thiol S-methyltransferase METTL7B-like isoform X1 [Uloborus diversus]|uniref:thiol S-methyltransferase METTL7B-like isoform X1 n=1 Tax=Uloborus diversus TaxID=327109 RepID=UPI0024093D43|nr:thiol S-methyltransferase METTL7B-like isoform X1 [Uloborus diversus]
MKNFLEPFEFLLWSAFAIIWWTLTLTALFPFVVLLKCCKTFRNKWFAWLFTKLCIPIFDSKLIPLRKAQFALLDRHLSQRNKSVPLKVLEIGIGSGANLPFYPENSKLTTVDMNKSFGEYFRQNQKNYPQVSYERAIHGFAENMKEIEDSSMDVVVSTYTLCSVADVTAVLKEVKRVLKPGGKYVFHEHIAYPSTEWKSTLQWVVAPIWRTYFDGCCLNRNLDADIRKTGFSDIICDKKYLYQINMFVRPHIVGIATK